MSIPDFLNAYYPKTVTTTVEFDTNLLKVIPEVISRTKRFEPIKINKNRGPLMINDKRWYFRLVHNETKRGVALMDNYPLGQLADHLVVCFTPKSLPDSNEPFINKDGERGRIYAYFDSYIEFIQYMKEVGDFSFYEIIFGEFPQKPHFDIDINLKDVQKTYPNEDIGNIGEIVKDQVISACISILSEHGVILNINKDILVYTSHGDTKRSYHIIINNYCHDNNKDAKGFYDKVIETIKPITENKYIEYIDSSLYSPRQQLRIVGCEKQGSSRFKQFNEDFVYQGKTYKHIYNEEVTGPEKDLVVMYESLVGFKAGCKYLPSFAKQKAYGYSNLTDMNNLTTDEVEYCMSMMKEKIKECPFSIKDVTGHIISLKRERPSYCPIHQKTHEHENPYIYVLGGKIYWDCRRDTDNCSKIHLGYLGYSYQELKEKVEEEDDGDEGSFVFGDFDIGAPTQKPLIIPVKEKPVTSFNIPISERKVRDVRSNLVKVSKDFIAKHTRKNIDNIVESKLFSTVGNKDNEWSTRMDG
jgi:hypothetical protein